MSCILHRPNTALSSLEFQDNIDLSTHRESCASASFLHISYQATMSTSFFYRRCTPMNNPTDTAWAAYRGPGPTSGFSHRFSHLLSHRLRGVRLIRQNQKPFSPRQPTLLHHKTEPSKQNHRMGGLNPRPTPTASDQIPRSARQMGWTIQKRYPDGGRGSYRQQQTIPTFRFQASSQKKSAANRRISWDRNHSTHHPSP